MRDEHKYLPLHRHSSRLLASTSCGLPAAMSSMNEKQPLLNKPGSNHRQRYVLVIHGGAGTMSKDRSTPEQRANYKAALSKALQAGHAVLKDGGEAMDAAVAAVSTMEDCPLFNSGKGSVFNVAGKNELETSIMLSKPPASVTSIPPTRRGFGITLLTHVRNPSKLARALYLAPVAAPHTMLSGLGAEEVGRELGIELVDESYFWTENRWREHRRGLGLPEEPLPYPPVSDDSGPSMPLDQLPKGTVGAVALDVRGCIAAVTSTGGRTNKLVGRIGDTPSMGSGFWAEEWVVKSWWRRKWRALKGQPSKIAVGVSGTGDGDYFIRLATASTIGRRIRYRHESVKKAAAHCVEELRHDGGEGGVIALDNKGHVAMPSIVAVCIEALSGKMVYQRQQFSRTIFLNKTQVFIALL
ncbi:asparaginase [Cristinia sonorae]|uniref:Asparaginase n=1 Tax=Cristinia sonorae TaxID=1940300 RepID=A0A8K0V1C2_9AGAR|nr:asparaginase [Cristinia sonorae]